jgi:hypothetical protein
VLVTAYEAVLISRQLTVTVFSPEIIVVTVDTLPNPGRVVVDIDIRCGLRSTAVAPATVGRPAVIGRVVRILVAEIGRFPGFGGVADIALQACGEVAARFAGGGGAIVAVATASSYRTVGEGPVSGGVAQATGRRGDRVACSFTRSDVGTVTVALEAIARRIAVVKGPTVGVVAIIAIKGASADVSS